MEVVTNVCFGILTVAAALCLGRVMRPRGSLADRIVGLDSLLVILVAGIAVLMARTLDTAYTTTIIVATLLGFLTTVTVARFIERRGT